MSSFNWFNRQYNDRVDAQTEPAETSPEPQTESAETAAADATSDAAADYLNWAKAAYQNIQKRQQASAGASQPTVTETSQASESAPEVSQTADAPDVAESPVEPIAPAVELQTDETAPMAESAPESAAELTSELTSETAPETASELVAETVSDPAATSSPESVAESIAATPSSGETALPFWAQAEAERRERLERLKAAAIEEPEPVAATTATPDMETAASGIPGVEFDENFLWSAEVLASQGRRPEQISVEEITWLKRLRQGLDKTRRNLVNQLRAIVGQGPLNQDAVMEIESLLLQADVGVVAADYIIESLQTKLRQEALPPAEAIAYLKQILRNMLDNPLGKSYSPTFAPEKETLNIWLIAGVNGAGKTTTIGKIAHIAQKSGYNCLIAAADTFRAAAVQQVKVWGDRSNVEVIANPGKNTDPAAVVFDAIAAAQSRNTELLLIDTAGRLQNKKNLMDELSKVRRIIDKKAPNAKIESLLVLDATLGQNGLRQAEVFSEAAQLSGVVLTKLDGTAKGGIALAVVQQLGLPIRFIGAGEGIEDLRPFSSYEFVEALLSG
ncbi:MAG: signal recognition particle-docking protein FtsY [Leptolyngbyaceae cyanobacterium SM1_4_3]|nr:signal recognition particle-docking protein FtsY [Leptolyngbyaceae cyanobacterium SM1_4_3]NJN92418.1 signal recognition particle-docking protein FtsY [Leptolyngbyaceae cyanobacterium SL_5_14]